MRIVTVMRQWKTLTSDTKRMRCLLHEDEEHGWKFDINLHETATLMNEWIRQMRYFHALFPPQWLDCPNRPMPRRCWGLRDNIQTQPTPYDSSVRVIGPSQRTLPENTQHSQGTDIYDSDVIRTRNPSKRTVVDSRPRTRGPCDLRHKPQAL